MTGPGRVIVAAARRSYPGTENSVPLIRSDVVELLALWGRAEEAVDAELCVSELAANAIRHRPEGVRPADVVLTIELRDGGGLRLAVHDPWPGVPRAREVADDEESGRGLLLVAAVATHWGVASTASGKAVWCELRQPARSLPGTPADDPAGTPAAGAPHVPASRAAPADDVNHVDDSGRTDPVGPPERTDRGCAGPHPAAARRAPATPPPTTRGTAPPTGPG